MKLVNGKRSQLLEYLMIIAGTGLMALAINSVFDASGMVTGGFSGIAIIIKAGSQGIIDGGIPLWVTNMGLNIPLFLIGWKINGFSFVKKALIGEIALSTWLAIEPVWNLAGNDLLLAALYGGVIQGVGIGLVFLGGGTTGGTDMMAAIIQKYLQQYSIAQIMQVIDAGVVLVGMYVFGIHKALYAIIARQLTIQSPAIFPSTLTRIPLILILSKTGTRLSITRSRQPQWHSSQVFSPHHSLSINSRISSRWEGVISSVSYANLRLK